MQVEKLAIEQSTALHIELLQQHIEREQSSRISSSQRLQTKPVIASAIYRAWQSLKN